MKKLIQSPLILFIAVLFLAGSAQAKASKSKAKGSKTKVTKKVTADDENSQVGTSFAFDAASVRGKYQMAGQGIATVEDEKVMDDLLGLRRTFRDRQAQEDSRK
jgi:hypothetical protein